MSNFKKQKKELEKQRKQLAKQHRQKMAQNIKQFRQANQKSFQLGILEISLIACFVLGVIMVVLLFFLI